MFFYWYLIIGALSGSLAGLLGLGGGVIIVPALAFVFLKFHLVPADHVMHVAVATSLTTVMVTFISSLVAHIKRGSVRWDVVRLLLPGILLGVLIGSMTARYLPSTFLRIFFSLFLFFMAYRLFANPNLALKPEPSKLIMRMMSALIGLLSSILGVGGGVVMIPFLLRCKLEMRVATGTSVACGIGIALFSSLSYLFLSSTPLNLPWSTGYIYWPAFLGVSVASILFAPLGTAAAYRIAPLTLKKILAVFLILVGFDMLILQG